MGKSRLRNPLVRTFLKSAGPKKTQTEFLAWSVDLEDSCNAWSLAVLVLFSAPHNSNSITGRSHLDAEKATKSSDEMHF